MEYNIIVRVDDDHMSQREVFDFIAAAVSDHLDRHEDLEPEHVHIFTANGSHSVEL